jgi:hypothetical protein
MCDSSWWNWDNHWTNEHLYFLLLLRSYWWKKNICFSSPSVRSRLHTLELNEFFECTFNKHIERNQRTGHIHTYSQQEKRKEENGWETRSMQWRITSFQHFFPPGKARVRWKRNNKRNVRYEYFNVVFICTFNADLITSNTIKERYEWNGKRKEKNVSELIIISCQKIDMCVREKDIYLSLKVVVRDVCIVMDGNDHMGYMIIYWRCFLSEEK